MWNLSELAKGGTLCLSKAGLHAGTTSTLDIAAPNGAGVDFVIGGKLYHKADTNTITVNACTIQPALYSCLYLVQLDTDGALTVVKGTQVLTDDLGRVALHWPEPTAGKCVIGAFRIDTALGYTFTAGTTAIGTTGVTATFYDLLAVPDAPQAA
jgi:hypothetical protein